MSVQSLTSGLRTVTTVLDRTDLPQLPMVTGYSSGRVEAAWYLQHRYASLAEQRDAAREIRRAIGGIWTKSGSGQQMVYRRKVGDSLIYEIQVAREAVCERVVVGTEQVTIPAVEAEPARVETREIVEWRCGSLLDDEPEPVAAQAVTGHMVQITNADNDPLTFTPERARPCSCPRTCREIVEDRPLDGES